MEQVKEMDKRREVELSKMLIILLIKEVRGSKKSGFFV